MSRQVVAQARCLKAGILARFHDHWQLGQPAASRKPAAGFPPADTLSSHLFYRRVAFLACLAVRWSKPRRRATGSFSRRRLPLAALAGRKKWRRCVSVFAGGQLGVRHPCAGEWRCQRL